MIAPEPTAPRDIRAASPVPGAPARGGDRSGDEPVGTLRGAGVSVDTRLVGRIAALVGVLAVAVAAVVLFVAGYQKNTQITSLQTHGVTVDAKVTGCIGLLGGSGSNDAGYNCTASYEYAGRQYTEGVPGNDRPLATGSTVKGIVASDDPALLAALWLFTWRRSRAADRSEQ
jgi:Protein of unknown function (DUF3592)